MLDISLRFYPEQIVLDVMYVLKVTDDLSPLVVYRLAWDFPTQLNKLQCIYTFRYRWLEHYIMRQSLDLIDNEPLNISYPNTTEVMHSRAKYKWDSTWMGSFTEYLRYIRKYGVIR